MKAIKIIVLVSFFFTVFSRAFAQVEIPVTSAAQARADLILSSASMEAWMSSSAIANNNGSQSVGTSWIPGTKTTTEIVALAKFNLSIKVLDTTSQIETSVVITDKGGAVTFEGRTNAKPELINGVWTLPKAAGDIRFKMPWAKWIKLSKNVSQAWIVARDPQGFETQYELGVDGDKILFPTVSLGLRNAYVKSNFTDGSSIAWNIADGKQVLVTTIAVNPSATFSDVVSFKNQSIQVTGAPVTHVIPVIKSVGVIPTFEITVDNESIVSLDITTSEGGRPSGYMLKVPGGTAWTSWPVSINVGLGAGTPIKALKGTTYVVPVFKPEVLIEASQPTNTGGKG